MRLLSLPLLRLLRRPLQRCGRCSILCRRMRRLLLLVRAGQAVYQLGGGWAAGGVCVGALEIKVSNLLGRLLRHPQWAAAAARGALACG